MGRGGANEHNVPECRISLAGPVCSHMTGCGAVGWHRVGQGWREGMAEVSAAVGSRPKAALNPGLRNQLREQAGAQPQLG